MLSFRPKYFIVMSFILLTLCVFSFETNAQDRMTVNQRISFKRGASSAAVKKQIRKGTSHQYRIHVSEGQEMTVILTTGKKTSFTISNRIDGIIEYADGETMWKGMITRSGDYYIEIGTDATANYTLEVFVK
jgi:hypothetical protein